MIETKGAMLGLHAKRKGREFGRVRENRTHFAVNKHDPLNRLSRTERILIYCEMRDIFLDSADFTYIPGTFSLKIT